MPKMIFMTFFYSLIVITGGGFAYAQKPPQNTQLVTPTPAEAAPKDEIPKQISTIIVENNRLSVEFVNVSLGEILQSIGQKAGFKVEGFNKVLSTKVTTKFTDLDIDSGIIRLFSLVKESNYLINYDTKGSISKLKVYDIKTVGNTGAGSSISPATSPTGGTGAVPFRAWRSRRLRSLPPTPAPQTPQPGTPTQ